MRKLRDRHGLEAVDVPATYLMQIPPPSETLLMPVYPPFSENPLCFTCAVDSEMDVYMLVRLLIGRPGERAQRERAWLSRAPQLCRVA